MAKVLLVCDRYGWAYNSIAQCLLKYNTDPELELDILYLKSELERLKSCHGKYDLIFIMGWQLAGMPGIFGNYRNRLNFLDLRRTITGIHSHHTWDRKKTQPDKEILPPKQLVNFLKRFRAVNVVSQRLRDLFVKQGLNDVFYTPNGVDTGIFKSTQPVGVNNELIVGYSANKLKHDWRKGITEFIEPAAHLAGANLQAAAWAEEKRYRPLSEMPDFYNKLDVYICASSSEGFSLSVLEASACGRPVVSTRVGGCVDLIEEGVNGFLVDRNIDAIADRLKIFKERRDLLQSMGKKQREIIKEKWSWRMRVKDWLEFIKCSLP